MNLEGGKHLNHSSYFAAEPSSLVFTFQACTVAGVKTQIKAEDFSIWFKPSAFKYSTKTIICTANTPSSSSKVVVFYKVTTNTDLAHPKPLFLQEMHITFIQTSYDISQYRTYSICASVVNRHCWFISTELEANSTVSCARMKLMEHVYFLCKVHCGYFLPRNTTQLFSRMLGGPC